MNHEIPVVARPPVPSAAQFRAARAWLGASQAAVADASGTSHFTIRMLEGGKATTPYRVSPAAVAKVYNYYARMGFVFIGYGGMCRK